MQLADDKILVRNPTLTESYPFETLQDDPGDKLSPYCHVFWTR